MRVIFEYPSTVTESYPVEKQTTVTHDGRSYTKVGESCADLSKKERFYCLIWLVGNACLALFKRDWAQVKQLYEEIKSGREKVVHSIPTEVTSVDPQEFPEGIARHMKH